MRKIILVLIFAFVVSGCGSTATPNSSPTEINTPLPRPTVASSPTAILSPSAVVPTSEPPLKTSGPYFTYFRQINGAYQLVMMDADGGGRKVIELPQGFVDSLTNQQFGLDMKFVSPDGKWLAFYSGSAGKYGEIPAQGQSDLTLNLLNLATGEKQVVTPLLSNDYPNNFAEAAKVLNDPYKTAESLFDAFVNGITNAIGWSPDGRYLAFAGQMDGLSSDLYVYDLNTQKIQRLSSGDQELQWINWSPDGKWILHGSVFWVGEGMTFDIYAASLDDSSVRYISTNVLGSGIENWLNSHQYFEYDGQNGPGSFGLRLVDINTGKIIKIWDGSFDSYAIDKNNMWIAVLANSSDLSPINSSGHISYDPNFVPAIYLINLNTLEKRRVEYPDNTHIFHNVRSFGLGGQDFSVMDSTSQNSVFLSIAGNLTPTDLGDANLSVSPDAKYWLAITNQDIKIFSAENTLIKTIPLSTLDTIINDVEWRPDSAGLFLVNGTSVYSLDIPQVIFNVVETDLIDNYGSTYKWINGQ